MKKKISSHIPTPHKKKNIDNAVRVNFHIISLFPHSLESYVQESIIARAQKEKKISISYYNPRDFVKPTKTQAKNEKPYLRVDDKPYGGGPGMVIQAVPVLKAIDKALSKATGLPLSSSIKEKLSGLRTRDSKIKKKGFKKVSLVFLSPAGTQFNTEQATEFAETYSDIIIVCGRYEGIDARIKEVFPMIEISVGPFVTTGGELPAMILIDVISRQVPGVLGNFSSREESRISSSDVYTRPESFEYKGKTYSVPPILLSGNHKSIEDWKKEA